MTQPSWYLPLSKSRSAALERGLNPALAQLRVYEIAAVHFMLRLPKITSSQTRSPLLMQRTFATALCADGEQLRKALADAFDAETFMAGVRELERLGIGLLNDEDINKRLFLHADGTWNYDFASSYRNNKSALPHTHVRRGGVIAKLSDHQFRLINNIRANQEDSIEAQALAGTGKTYVLDEIMTMMPDRKFIFLADVDAKLHAIRARFPPERVRTSTFKKLAESFLAHGTETIRTRLVADSRLSLSYYDLAERAGISGLGNRTGAQVAYICWSVIFKYCASTDFQITPNHISEKQSLWLNSDEKNIIAAAATKLWKQMTNLDLEAPPLPIRGYHRIKQAALMGLHIPEYFDTVLIDEAHDLTGPMVEVLNKSPQTVISLGDQFQNLDGNYVPHRATIRHKEMSLSLRAGPALASYINPLLEIFPGATSPTFLANEDKEMVIHEYPANSFPPESTVILVEDNWGIFDWLLRSREMGKGAAVIDWDNSFEAFLEGCLNLYKFDKKAAHGAIASYRAWDHLHRDMKWNDSFLRVEEWLGTVGIKFGVSGLYKRADINELSNSCFTRPLLATVFTVKNFELPRLAISEDLFYSANLKGKKSLSKKLSLLYTAMTRASGKMYLPDTYHDWMAHITEATRNY